MKDLPHHIKKLNRQIIRSLRREEQEDELEEKTPPRKQTPRQIKKQAKKSLTKTRNARAPGLLTSDEKNKRMKDRVPVFDQNKGKRTLTKPTRKKTPRI